MEPPKKLLKLSDESEGAQLCLEIPHSFQPTGISYQQGDNRTILIVTGVNEILTFLLGDLKIILNSNKTIEPLKKNVIQVESEVLKVVHSKVRTYCLHSDQSLSSFASYKQLKKLKSPVGCRDIIKYKDGVAVLVKETSKNLVIEHLPDVNSENPQKIIDCGPAIDNERYSLASVTANERNSVFLKSLLGVEIKKEPILMFSVGNNVFWIAENDEIRLVRSYSSKVTKFWMSKNMFVVILDSGMMEVSYLCSLLGLVSSKRFHLYEDCWSSLNSEKAFVFSNGKELHEKQLKQVKNEIKMQKNVIELPGIVGIVHIKEVNRTLCISENRIIYHLPVKVFAEESVEELQLIDQHYLAKSHLLHKNLQKLLVEYQNYEKGTKESQLRHDLLENFHLKRLPFFSATQSISESLPEKLKNFKHILTKLNLSQNMLFLSLEMPETLPQKLENTFFLFEYSISFQLRKRICRLRDLLKANFLFDISQNGKNLSLPDIKASFVHLIPKTNDILMLKIKIKIAKKELSHEIVETNETELLIPEHKNLVNQILAEKTVTTSFKLPNSSLVLNNFNLSTENPRSVLRVLGKIAILELNEDVLRISSKDIGLLKYLKNFIVGQILDKKQSKIATNYLKSVEEFLPLLNSPNINSSDVIEWHRRIRSFAIQYSSD